MQKILYIGTIAVGARRAALYCKVKLENDRLSISGVEGPLKSGDALGGCGQIDMHYAHRDHTQNDKRYARGEFTHANEIRYAAGWNADAWLDFLNVWKRYHLNDMHAECEHQRALGWTYETHQGQKCPTCGYEIGTEWKSETIPADVIAYLESLPESAKVPAWV